LEPFVNQFALSGSQIETGMTFGPDLAHGRKSLILMGDNNFNPDQVTQFLAFAVTLNTIPTALPALETPQVIDEEPPAAQGALARDADDPASLAFSARRWLNGAPDWFTLISSTVPEPSRRIRAR
jgi:hypothetical protein